MTTVVAKYNNNRTKPLFKVTRAKPVLRYRLKESRVCVLLLIEGYEAAGNVAWHEPGHLYLIGAEQSEAIHS